MFVPCRVTAVTYPGLEGPVNIAREVEMSGPSTAGGLISKGSRIASLSVVRSCLVRRSFLSRPRPSMATVLRNRAVCTARPCRVYRSGYAVTGMEQHGMVQPVGAINEKVESFFDICESKGLTGDQGVLVPSRIDG